MNEFIFYQLVVKAYWQVNCVSFIWDLCILVGLYITYIHSELTYSRQSVNSICLERPANEQTVATYSCVWIAATYKQNLPIFFAELSSPWDPEKRTLTSKEQTSLWQANSDSAKKKKSAFRYRVYKIPPLDLILSQMNPVHRLAPIFFKILININLPYRLRSPNWFLFSTKMYIFDFNHVVSKNRSTSRRSCVTFRNAPIFTVRFC